MGITYSTDNYEKIINIIEKPYFKSYQNINKNLFNAVNIDNDNRFLVYKHKEKDYFLLYIGGICNVSQCFEVHENSLLRFSQQFSRFYNLKEYIVKNFPETELMIELVKYESENYIDILGDLEQGLYDGPVEINFTDSESGDYSDTESENDSDTENDNCDIFNNSMKNIENIIKEIKCNNNDYVVNFDYDNGWLTEKTINDSADEYCSVLSEKPADWDLNWVFNLDEVKKTISKRNDFSKITNNAVKIAIEASEYANNITEEALQCINEVSAFDIVFVDDAYLEPIEEEITSYDSSDSDIIFPDMNYMNRLD